MLQHERLHRIQSLLNRLHRVSTERIINDLKISRETARRDIIELENLGLCKRVHGGIVANDPVPIEAPLNIRTTQNAREKRAIAKLAVQQLQSGQTIFLDAGSTTSIFAEELKTLSGITVITNSFQVAINMSNDELPMDNQIILLGGSVHSRLQTQGDFVISEIQRYHVDFCVLSAVGVSPLHGATSFYVEEANIAKAMLKNSHQSILLADPSKLNVVSRVQYAKPHEISMLITTADETSPAQEEDFQTNFKQILFA